MSRSLALLATGLTRFKPTRKWIENDPVWMRKSEAEPFEFKMFVKSWHYNEDRKGWDYRLRDEEGNEYADLVKETDTKAA